MCTAHASARFCCRVERPIPAHHHASDNVFFRSPSETFRICPSAFWPRSAGSTASDQYYADDRPSSFCLRRDGTSARAGSPRIVIAGFCPSVRAGDALAGFSGAVSRAACVTLPTIACPPSLTDTCCTVTFCSPPVRYWRIRRPGSKGHYRPDQGSPHRVAGRGLDCGIADHHGNDGRPEGARAFGG